MLLINQANEDGAGSSGESIGLVIRVEDSVNDDQVNNNKNKQQQQQQQQETVVVLTLPVDNVSDFLQQYQLQPRQRQPQQQPLAAAANSNPLNQQDAVTAGGLSFRRANIHPQSAAAVPSYNYYYQQRPPYYYYNQESLFPLAQFYRQFYGLP